MKKDLFDFDTKGIKFNSRPITLAANYRITWKSAFVVFLIGKLAGRHAVSLKRLSVFNWTLQKSIHYSILDEIVLDQNRIAAASIKYEPSLSRTLLYLVSIKLIEVNNAKYSLTGSGLVFFDEINQSTNLFVNEKRVLEKYNVRQISEKRILSILDGG